MPSPNDHVRAIIELLRPASPDLARRWLAALLVVPVPDRAALVEAIERRIADTYPRPHEDREITVVFPPQQRDGYVEQIEKTYAVKKKPAAEKAAGRKSRSMK